MHKFIILLSVAGVLQASPIHKQTNSRQRWSMEDDSSDEQDKLIDFEDSSYFYWFFKLLQ
jgi:hypothetical protein